MNRVTMFVINLDRSKDRWKEIERSINEFSIPNVERFSAIDSQNLSQEHISLIEPRAWKMVQNKTKEFACDHVLGSVGCYLSHVFALKKFIEQGREEQEVCIVAEDDISLNREFPNKVQEVLKKAPQGWGLIHLGKVNPKVFGKSSVPKIEISGGITFVSFPSVGASCYAVTREFANKIVREAFPSKVQYDWFLSQMLCREPNKIYYLFRPIVRFNEFSTKSDILGVTKIRSEPWKAPKGLDGLKDRPKSMDFRGSCCTVDYTLVWILVPLSFVLVVFLIVFLCFYFQYQQYNIFP